MYVELGKDVVLSELHSEHFPAAGSAKERECSQNFKPQYSVGFLPLRVWGTVNDRVGGGGWYQGFS